MDSPAEGAEGGMTTTAAPAPMKKWYIVHTYSGHENKAKLTIVWLEAVIVRAAGVISTEPLKLSTESRPPAFSG